MSGMTLRLDTAGLRSLIAENESFQLEIQQAVINNIRQDNIENAVRDRVTAVLRGMCSGSGSWYNSKLKLNDKFLIDAIKEVVVQEVKLQAKSVIVETVHDVLIAERTRLAREMKDTVKEAMLLALTPEMAKEILLAKLI